MNETFFAPMPVQIVSTGHYVPDRRVANAEIEADLDLETGWIERRTGIVERRWAADDEAVSDMAVRAAKLAFSRAGLDDREVGLLVLATSTPDHLLPPTAPLVAHRLGLSCGAVDMAGACAGFLYALTLADGYVRSHNAPAIVVAANILSRRMNFTDQASAILFSDAAGAVVLAPGTHPRSGVLGVQFASEGANYDLIKIPAGGSRRPFRTELDPGETLMQISDGRAVFAKAVAMMAGTSRSALAAARLDIADVDHWIPHQANQRIISATQAKLGLGDEAVLSSVRLYGNSSAASIPLTLSLAADSQDFKAGDILLMSAAGAGLTGGSVVWGF